MASALFGLLDENNSDLKFEVYQETIQSIKSNLFFHRMLMINIFDVDKKGSVIHDSVIPNGICSKWLRILQSGQIPYSQGK